MTQLQAIVAAISTATNKYNAITSFFVILSSVLSIMPPRPLDSNRYGRYARYPALQLISVKVTSHYRFDSDMEVEKMTNFV